MKKVLFSACVMSLALSACGGGGQAAEAPPATPPPAPAPVQPPTPAPVQPAPAPTKLSLADLQKKSLADSHAAWTEHDAKKLSSLYAEDVTFAYPGAEGLRETHGRGELEKNMDAFFKAFPDVKLGPVRDLVVGDVVVTEWIVAGTHSGDFMGLKPTNKKVGYRGLSVMWFGEDGLVKREHMYMDHGTFMAQLGVAPKGVKGRAFMDVPSADARPEWIASAGTDIEKKNAEAATAFFATFGKKDEKGYLDARTADSVDTAYTAPDDLTGKDNLKKHFQQMAAAFPDMQASVKNQWAAGDYVAAEVEWTGTMKGALGPVKPTNKTGTIHSFEILQFKDGKLAHRFTYGSGAEFAMAFGLMPKETPQAPTTVKQPPKGPVAPPTAPKPTATKAGATPLTPGAAGTKPGATKTAPMKPATPATPATPAKPGTPAKPATPAKPPVKPPQTK